jgi:hypothetical protein
MNAALIGLSNNLSSHISKVKVWAKSFKKHFDGNVYLLCANSTENEIEQVKQLGIIAVPVTVENTWYINHKRLEHIHNLILTIPEEHLIITDVFDVVFQNNPFQKLDFENYNVFVGQEGVLVSEEPWNADNINKIFPQQSHLCKNLPVVCSGVIAGKKQALIPLYKQMFELCEEGSNNHNIKDQAALHILIALDKIPKLKQFTLNDGWVMHCATSGPTQFFKSWGFDYALSKKGLHVPVLENGVVKTNNLVYDMVHQFNRVPEWNTILTSPYE